MLAQALPLKSLYLTGRKPSAAPQPTTQAAHTIIEEGGGWSPARKAYGYAPRIVDQLQAGLAKSRYGYDSAAEPQSAGEA